MKPFNYKPYQDQLLPFFKMLEHEGHVTPRQLNKLIKMHLKPDGTVFAKDELVQAYRGMAGHQGLKSFQQRIASLLQMKPIRTASGVAPVTVLTKPFPCPGKCIFCPSDIRMPKSYLSDEPGAQRAERNYFDPYLQTYNRLQALKNIGHITDKVEIIVLGGTWSYYPESYQIWFIKECFRALNDFGTKDDRVTAEQWYQAMEQKLTEAGEYAYSNDPEKNKKALESQQLDGSDLQQSYNQVIAQHYVAPERKAGLDTHQSADWSELEDQQCLNEVVDTRCVGLVVETRPDNISPAEVMRMRRLGCTKTQIGFQSLSDTVLRKNRRGHDVAATRRAVRLLRQAGFKIHAHWMANLYGSSVADDKADYDKLFSDPDFKPDELKVYPCSLLSSAELMQYYQRGDWQPYEYDQLAEVLVHCLESAPEYCRLTRVIRDIPSTDIVAGNKFTNFRQIAQQKLEAAGKSSHDIRAREIRRDTFDPSDLVLDELRYQTSVSEEVFLQWIVKDTRKIVGFLRLSLPSQAGFIDELANSAIIREVHVYGKAAALGVRDRGKAQHSGLGTQLLESAIELAREAGFETLAVISAIGTREYYRGRGFSDGELYQHCTL